MPPWGQLLATLERIGASLGGVLGIVNNILGIVNSSQSSMTAIEEQGTETFLYVSDATDGLPAIISGISDLMAGITSNQTALLAAIGAAQQSGSPVTLPTVPPTGYGGDSAADIAAAVWSDTDTGTGEPKSTLLIQAGMVAENFANYSVWQTGGSPYLWFRGQWNVKLLGGGIDAIPIPDPANVLIADTPLSWLQRESPAWDWELNINGSAWVGANSTSGPGTWELHVTEEQWVQLVQFYHPVLKDNVVAWPGLANVTLSAPLDLDRGLTFSGVCHGVIVNLASVPTKASFFTFDDVNSYRNLGAIAFFSDNGDEEPAQSLGFANAVYTPRHIHQAAGFKLRTVGGVIGTVTPWSITQEA